MREKTEGWRFLSVRGDSSEVEFAYAKVGTLLIKWDGILSPGNTSIRRGIVTDVTVYGDVWVFWEDGNHELDRMMNDSLQIEVV